MYKYLILISLIAVVYYCFIHQKDVEGMASIKRKKPTKKTSKKTSIKKTSSKKAPAKKVTPKVAPKAKEEVKAFSEAEVRTEAEVHGEGVHSESETVYTKEDAQTDKILGTEIPQITNTKNEISKAISVADINTVVTKSGLDVSTFNFKTIADIDTAKFSATKLLDLLTLFKNMKIDDKTGNETIKDLLGLSMSDETFKDILVRNKVPASYQKRFLVKFTEILKPIKLLTFTKEAALDDIPNKVMLNISQVFPRGDSDDLCAASAKLLGNMRNRRIISFDEYNTYQGKINEKCLKRSESNTVVVATPNSEVKATEVKSIKEVPLDKAVGLPTLKQDAATYQDYINNKNKAAENLNIDVVSSTNSTFNSMTGLFGF